MKTSNEPDKNEKRKRMREKRAKERRQRGEGAAVSECGSVRNSSDIRGRRRRDRGENGISEEGGRRGEKNIGG